MDETRGSSKRLQAARTRLLNQSATGLLEQVRGAFCESTRSQILRALTAGPLTVNEIAAVIGRTKWATSQHLRILRKEELVVGKRRGRAVYYRVAESPAAASAIRALAIVEELAEASA
jgi:DNA-binding transcriptional ArsR family regulator